MNFTITDGNNDWLDLVPEFVELYNANYLSVQKLMEVMGITRGTYRQLRKYCIEEGLIVLRRLPNKTRSSKPKNYSRVIRGDFTYFNVRKNQKYYCTCKTREQAEEIVRRLEACGWDISKVQSIKESVCE